MDQSESDHYISSTDEEATQIITKRKKAFSGPSHGLGGLPEDDEVREEALIRQLKQYEGSAKEKDLEIEKLKRQLSETNRTLTFISPMSPNVEWICETLENVYLKHSLGLYTRPDTLSEGFIPSDVGNYIRQAGRSSDEIKHFIHWLQTIIKKSLKDIKRLWTGYRPQNDAPVFVATVDELNEDFPTQVMNFEIIQRVDGHMSDEAKFVLSREIEKSLTFSAEEQSSISKCLSKYSACLMKNHSNLTVTSASKIKSVCYGSENASYNEMVCIVLYVDVKGVIPIHEEPFPQHLDGIPVDVREGTFKTYGKHPAEYHEQLMMGCQIVTDYKTSGTLGGFLQMGNNKLGCLTCCHVFDTPESLSDFQQDPRNHSFVKKDVYQPFPAAPYKIGKLSKWMRYQGDENNIGIDAALIEISDPLRYPQSGHFPNAESCPTGFSPETPMRFNSGEVIKCINEVPKPCNVAKYGAGTGHTSGTVRLFGPAVRVTSYVPEVLLHQQFEIVSSLPNEAFSKEGDSGALVFLLSDLNSGLNIRALGLLVGGTSHNTTIVTPIWAVLGKFNLPLKLLKFESESCLLPPRNSRLDGIEKDVEELKSNVSELVEKTLQTDQRMNVMEGKIDQVGLLTQRTEQNIHSKLDMQHAQLLSLLTNKNSNLSET